MYCRYSITRLGQLMPPPRLAIRPACAEADLGVRGSAISAQSHSSVEVPLVCGHVHRQMQLRFAGTVLRVAPSMTTAIALRPHPTAQPASFIEPPGFLLHHWKAGTGLLTQVFRSALFPGPPGSTRVLRLAPCVKLSTALGPSDGPCGSAGLAHSPGERPEQFRRGEAPEAR